MIQLGTFYKEPDYSVVAVRGAWLSFNSSYVLVDSLIVEEGIYQLKAASYEK